MTASELKYLYEHNGLNGGRHFFERSSMRFFGDVMRNYGVRSVSVRHQYRQDDPEPFAAWELYRRRPVKHGLCSSHYFTTEGFLCAAVVEV